ncbi:hypothetical protein [Jiella sonneratiae]|uniref:Uncharacterized protein n=1 Tax=Jiella sonneratiae TaxID=2816856 RepID=A0ABS3J7Y3_9HYPH|nr:hypothetical protein [Jiella sonneratiae]MBO0905777.1 hypothetical protein [Jiella sonneratiae]
MRRGAASPCLALSARLVLAALIAVPLGLRAGPASAAGRDDAVRLVASEFERAFAGFSSSNCIGPEERRPYEATFYGIPAGDPHFTDGDRNRINQLVLDGLQAPSSVQKSVSAAANAGALAPITGLGTTDQNQLAAALDKLGSSTFPSVLKASRPEPGVARLDLSVFARGGAGAYGCNRSISFNLALDTLEPMADTRGARDYVTLDGAYRLALDQLAPRLGNVSGVYLKPSETPSCAYVERAVERFEDAYYGSGQMDFAAGRTNRTLPDLLIDAPGADSDAATLELAFTVPDRPDDTFGILASLRAKGRLLSRQRFAVAAESDELDECRARPEPVVEVPGKSDAGEAAKDDAATTSTADASAGKPAADGAAAGDGSRSAVPTDGAEGVPSTGAGAGTEAQAKVAGNKASGVSTDPTPGADGTIPTVPVPVASVDEPGGTSDGGVAGAVAALDDTPQPITVPDPLPPSCSEDGEILDFSVAPSVGHTGDRLALKALVRQCTPAFFAFASGKVTPIPTSVFETSAEGGDTTAYEASPHTRKKLVLQKEDPVGLNKIVLFCSKCIAAPTQKDVVGWLRGIRDELESDRRSSTSTLPGGVGYAFGSVEKVN